MPAAAPPAAPTVAIIVRTIGHPLLARALASIEAQTWPAVHIVLVLADPAARPPTTLPADRSTVVASSARLPRPVAANRGLDAARADWIGFLDEDDWLAPTHVAGLLAALGANPGHGLAYSDTVIADPTPTVMRRGYWKQRFQDYPLFTINAALFAAALPDRGCRFDPELALSEDWDFWLQCAEHTDFLHVGAATAYYDPGSGTSGMGRANNLDHLRQQPHHEVLRRKWGARYQAIETGSRRALAEATTAIGGGDIAGAAAVIGAALVADPGNPLLLNRLALCRQRQGDTRGAVAALSRACDVDAASLDLALQLALLEHAAGDVAAAARTLAAAGALARSVADAAKLDAAARTVARG